MTRSCRNLLPLLGVVGALALGGCVDMFTSKQPANAEHWHGVTTAGVGGGPVCGPFALDLGLFADPLFMWQTVSGRAYPSVSSDPDSPLNADGITTWWLEGYMTSANFVEFETRLQRPILPALRPYSVWRGTRNAERMMLVESGSPCDREVVLTRG